MRRATNLEQTDDYSYIVQFLSDDITKENDESEEDVFFDTIAEDISTVNETTLEN